MQFVWTPELSVGDPALDTQHQGIFRETSELLKTIVHDTPDPQKVQQVIAFLDQYIAEHFSAEEAYMSAHAYPGLKEHQAIHQSFQIHYTELKKRIAPDHPTAESLMALESYLGQWLVHHVSEEDMKYTRFIQDRQMS